MRGVVLVILGLSVAAILFTVCSKKSTKPESRPDTKIPVIDSLSSESGWPGEVLAIFGSQFDPTIDSTKHVLLGDSAATVRTWSDTLAEIDIPDRPGKTTVGLHNGQSMSNRLPFGINGIVGVEPESGQAGDTICILGLGFGDSQDSSTIELGGITADVVSWSDTLIEALIPDSVTSVGVRIMVEGHTSVWDAFEPSAVPVIRVIEPDWGPWGTVVEVYGHHFGEQPAVGEVHFGEVDAPISMWSDTLITTKVPLGATSGGVTVSQSGIESNKMHFEVFRVHGVSPAAVELGEAVFVTGEGFGELQGASSVTVDDQEQEVICWHNDSICIRTTLIYLSGLLVVHVNGIGSNSVSLTVVRPELPTVISISPDFGTYGTEVQIRGIGFGDRAGNVTFGGKKPRRYWEWSDELIGTVYPEGSESGDLVVETRGGARSNPFPYEVFGLVRGYLVASDEGDRAILQSRGLGAIQGENYVDVNGTTADVLHWSQDSMVVLVPDVIYGGVIHIRVVKDGMPSNPVHLSLLHLPRIVSVEPTHGTYGTQFTVWGENFEPNVYSRSHVLTGTLDSPVEVWTGNMITAAFPHRSTSSDVRVIKDKYYWSNGIPVTIFGIMSIEPVAAWPGDIVLIGGTGFGETQGSNYVLLNETEIPVLSWSEDQITVPISAGDSSGELQVVIDEMPSNAAGIFVMADESTVIQLLPKTNFIQVRFRAALQLTGNRRHELDLYLYAGPHQGNVFGQLDWDSFSFDATADPWVCGWPCYTVPYWAHNEIQGTVDADALIIDTADCRFTSDSDGCMGGGGGIGYCEYWEAEYSFTLSDLPLTSAEGEDTLDFRFEASGASVANIVGDLYVMHRNHGWESTPDGWHFWDDRWYLESILWDDPSVTPLLEVTFKKR